MSVLVAKHDEFCIMYDSLDADGECTMECRFAARQEIAREQHAHDEAENAEWRETWRKHWSARLAEVESRLARYEAPGPAVLVAEHDAKCPRDICSWGCSEPNCYKNIRDAAYREQHARDVAAVERLLREAEKSADDADWSGSAMADAAAIEALKVALAALTDEAKS